jgi:hypothetical protein
MKKKILHLKNKIYHLETIKIKKKSASKIMNTQLLLHLNKKDMEKINLNL